MKISRPAMDRLLDPANRSVTLSALGRERPRRVQSQQAREYDR